MTTNVSARDPYPGLEGRDPYQGQAERDPGDWTVRRSVQAEPGTSRLGDVLDAVTEQAVTVGAHAPIDATVTANLGAPGVRAPYELVTTIGVTRTVTGTELSAAGLALAGIDGVTSTALRSCACSITPRSTPRRGGSR